VGLACVGMIVWTLPHPFMIYVNQATARGVYQLLRLKFPTVIYLPEEDLVGVPSFLVEIICPCGGYYGMSLILSFLALYLWLFRHALRFPAALALVPVGVGLMWLLNLGRITTLVILGAWNSPWVNVDGFHSQAGWLAFLGVSLGLVAVAQHSRFLSVPETSSRATPERRAAAAYVAPLLAIVAVLMLGRIFSTGLDWLYPARVLAAGVLLWLGRKYYTDWHWTWSWSALALGVGVFLLWLALEPLAAGEPSGPSLGRTLASLPRSVAGCWLVWRMVGSVLTVPLAEELAFRGYLTRRLIDADFQRVPPDRVTAFACLASSVLFGVVHGRWLAGTLAGLAYAWAYARRGELADAVQAHAVTNALIAAYVLATGSWALWAS
ncbi:MAG: exosortase E/protease, VPEID-CTERM system, partial [Planctomycetes bacterium]|nr:exosortase E/protease, VPEID-CTERM system [Planctomycetota bacterium]